MPGDVVMQMVLVHSVRTGAERRAEDAAGRLVRRLEDAPLCPAPPVATHIDHRPVGKNEAANVDRAAAGMLAEFRAAAVVLRAADVVPRDARPGS